MLDLKNLTLVASMSSALLFGTAGCRENAQETSLIPPSDSSLYADIVTRYDIPVDSFRIFEGRIRPNQFLSDVLVQNGLPFERVQEAVQEARKVMDIRKIISGNRYTAFCTHDSIKNLKYFIYEHSPSDYYIFAFNDSVKVSKKTKAVRTEIRSSTGVISTSLWDAMKETKVNPMMAIELSEIFAWSIDFFGLQTGDRFNVIYEESFVDSISTGITKIFGAYFGHMGVSFYAIPFVQDGVESFFDEEGNSLRKAFLKAPLRFSRISSRFSGSRLHPILKIRRPHYGIDYAAPIGTPVYAIGDGIITRTSFEGQAGRMVSIKHNSVYSTAYLHLRNFAAGVAPGAYVKQGQVIGYVGSTGLSTGPHLDFRFYKNGHPVDPLRVESPPVEPVKPENMAEFMKKKEIMVGLLSLTN